MKRCIPALGAALALVLSLAACSGGQTSSGGASSSAPGSASSAAGSSSGEEHALVLADGATTLDGQALTDNGPVTLTHDILYYEDRDTYESGSPYGEGTQEERHSAEEAAAHTVITIQEAGTYRVSGTLNPGQLLINLGEGAKTNPDARVTLILDGADITCTVAPAVLFEQVYECDQDYLTWLERDETPSGDADTVSDGQETEKDTWDAPTEVDTSRAGAQVILADGSSSTVNGSHIARIYEDGSEDKLCKYDGAFYSTASMRISGEQEGTGTLSITADNEGLDSELHLTVAGGNIAIQAQNDGINTNEDGVSVTSILGGTLQINAGLGEEGDAIDSNGHLVIQGGNVYACASDHSPDGGLDADGEILLNGGFVVATGIRNDAISGGSTQPWMELSFASTLISGSQVDLKDPEGQSLLSFQTGKACQSIVFSSPDLQEDVAYSLLANGIQQQYTGNASGGFGFGGGQRPDGGRSGTFPDGQQPPEGFDPGQRPQRGDGTGRGPQGAEGQPPQLPDNGAGQSSEPTQGQPLEPPAGEQSPENSGDGLMVPPQGSEAESAEPSVEFTITDRIHAFSGISDSVEASGRTPVTFSAEIVTGEDGTVSIGSITASQDVDPSHVQLTVTDVPSEDYAAACLWSDGEEAIAGILPEDPGMYLLTIAVAEDDSFTGTSQFQFVVSPS